VQQVRVHTARGRVSSRAVRPTVAVLAGLALVVVLSMAGQTLAASWLAAPDGSPLPVGRTYLSATLAITFAAAVVGGFVAAHGASAHRFRVAAAVAALSAGLGVMSALSAPEGTPAVIAWAMPGLAALGALGGGGVRVAVK
jgi:hypothetical protein